MSATAPAPAHRASSPHPTARPRSDRPTHSPLSHARAAALFFVLTVLVGGVGYPLVVTGFAELVTPTTANGSLLTAPNGTVVGSRLVAQNLTGAPYLFWARPSLNDYNLTLGVGVPYGPTDPALVNETKAFMALYGNGTVNATLPLWLVSPSASGTDPDLVPQAVLVQIPRVAAATGLGQPALLAFVNARIHPAVFGFIGNAYVDVLSLDWDLLHLFGRV